MDESAFVSLDSGERFAPISATNNLFKHGAPVFAEKPEPYGSVSDLIKTIEAYHSPVQFRQKWIMTQHRRKMAA